MNGYNALITVLEKATNEELVISTGKGLVRLAPRVPIVQVERSWERLVAVHENSTDSDILSAAGDGLVALCPRLGLDHRVRTAETLALSIRKAPQTIKAKQLAAVIKVIDAPYQDRIVEKAMESLLERMALTPSTVDAFAHVSRAKSDYSVVRVCLQLMSNPRTLANIMSHAGCVDVPREFILERFEELVCHKGEPVYLKPGDANGISATNGEMLSTPPRRFHNLHDAAEWIERCWPDFDLETNHTFTWREEGPSGKSSSFSPRFFLNLVQRFQNGRVSDSLPL